MHPMMTSDGSDTSVKLKMAQGCKIEESITGSSYFFKKRRISKVHDYEIKRLSE